MFDNPKVLAKINSVYVTAESANKPSGVRLIVPGSLAYFGAQPNHP